MGKVIVHATLSVDGFMAGPNDEMAWVFEYGGTDKVVEEVMQTTGAVVLGKRTFDVSLKQDQMPYGGALKVPQFVVTHEKREPEEHGGLSFTFINGGVEEAVAMARECAGDQNVSLLGATLSQACLQAGLVDEIVIHLVPVLLGWGIRLFERPGERPIPLEKVETVSTDGMTSLRFRIIK